MSRIGEQFQSADWKAEKHVPVIDCHDTVNADENFSLTVTIGKEIAHPNTTEHHISWVQLFFKAEREKFTHHTVTTALRIKKPGTLIATSLCNIHGLWESSKEIKLK